MALTRYILRNSDSEWYSYPLDVELFKFWARNSADEVYIECDLAEFDLQSSLRQFGNLNSECNQKIPLLPSWKSRSQEFVGGQKASELSEWLNSRLEKLRDAINVLLRGFTYENVSAEDFEPMDLGYEFLELLEVSWAILNTKDSAKIKLLEITDADFFEWVSRLHLVGQLSSYIYWHGEGPLGLWQFGFEQREDEDKKFLIDSPDVLKLNIPSGKLEIVVDGQTLLTCRCEGEESPYTTYSYLGKPTSRSQLMIDQTGCFQGIFVNLRNTTGTSEPHNTVVQNHPFYELFECHIPIGLVSKSVPISESICFLDPESDRDKLGNIFVNVPKDDYQIIGFLDVSDSPGISEGIPFRERLVALTICRGEAKRRFTQFFQVK